MGRKDLASSPFIDESKNGDKKILNLEETTTSAETTIRTKYPSDSPSIYFSELGERDPYSGYYRQGRFDTYRHDRKILRVKRIFVRNKKNRENEEVIEDGKAIKGWFAINRLKKLFRFTRISKRKEGDEEAIKTYAKLKKERE